MFSSKPSMSKVEQYVNEAANKASARDRVKGVRKLKELSLSKENGVILFDTPGVVGALLHAAAKGENTKTKENGLVGLRYLAYAEANVVRLSDTPGVVDALLAATSNGETAEIKENGLAGLLSLASAKENGARLIDTPGVVDALLAASVKGENTKTKENGLAGLLSLASTKENTVRLVDTPGVVGALLDAAVKGETVKMKENGVSGLVNIAGYWENVVRLMDTPGVVDTFLMAVTKGETKEIKENGWRGLAKLAFGDCAISKRLMDTPGLVDALLVVNTEGETVTLREERLFALAIIASARPNRGRLMNIHGVMDAFLVAARDGETAGMIEYGLLGLANLANFVENRARLLDTRGVVDAFLLAATKGETAEIKKHGLVGLRSLSDDPLVAYSLFDRFDLLNVLLSLPMDNSVAIILLNLAVAPKSRAVMSRDSAVIACLTNASSASEKKTSLFAKLALAILTGSDEKQSEFLRADPYTLQQILNILSVALKGESTFANDWPLNHPVIALRYLTTVDANRLALGTVWLPQLLQAIDMSLEEDNSAAAESAVNCLLQYTFDEKTLLIFRANPEYTSVAQRVVTEKTNVSDWVETVKLANRLLFKLEGRDDVVPMTVTFANKNRLMISYAWGLAPHENQCLAKAVKARLVARGFDVWLDIDQMKGDIQDAMADAVTQSSAVIVLVTKTYKESGSCKSELTFANTQKKKVIPLLAETGYDYRVDGWLGFSLGARKCFDISRSNTREAQLDEMISKELTDGE